MRPKISVVIPTHDRPGPLGRLLGSLARQTFRPSEVLVVDDASAQRGEVDAVLKAYARKVPRLRLLRNDSPQGAPFSRNRGIRAAVGPWIALSDDDDEWRPDKLRKQAELIRRGPGLDLVYTWAEVVTDGVLRSKWRSQVQGAALDRILSGNFIPASSVVTKKSALLRAGLFDERLPSCQDWDLWIRMFRAGSLCDLVPSDETVHHLSTRSSITASRRGLLGYLWIFRKNFPILFRESPWKALRFTGGLAWWLFLVRARLVYKGVLVSLRTMSGGREAGHE